MDWFDNLGLEFVRGVPALRPDDDGLSGKSIFEPQPRGTAFERFVVQFAQIFTAGQKEGGLFIMIGRKPADVVVRVLSDETAVGLNTDKEEMVGRRS